MEVLRGLLRQLEGKGFKAYKALQGKYSYPNFTLLIDHVQGDPFADPSRVRVRMAPEQAGFPPALWDTPVRRIALEDFLGRCLSRAIARHVRGHRGSGNSGVFLISTSGQQILARNAVLISSRGVEARLRLGLPAFGRSIRAKDAAEMLVAELPRVVRDGLTLAYLSCPELERHVDTAEDQHFLRSWLESADLCAFVADGAILPRASGVDDRPLAQGAIPFRAPDAIAREVVLPHAGRIRGMGIPRGVTLVVGGGFHGKSTLLQALERGVYNHIPGDGRERVVTDASAVKIRAENGRAVTAVDISPFIVNLPCGQDTRCFTSANASGSTSQAANIVEALNFGARLLLVDEDTSATNFMIRDARMARLVSTDKEPITPFVRRVRQLYTQNGVSTILVMGGCGDYFSEADTVIMMDEYRALDATKKARALAGPAQATERELLPLTAMPRHLDPTSITPCRGHRREDIRASLTWLRFGEQEVDLSGLEQLVDRGQTLTIGYLIAFYARRGEARESLVDGLRKALERIGREGFDGLLPYIDGTLALPRLAELVAAVNRFRGVHFTRK